MSTIISSKKKAFIDGQFVDGVEGQYEAVINPATEQVIAEVPVCSEEDVNLAVSAAERAFESWGETTPAERSKALLKLADTIERKEEEFMKIESQNVGKPIEKVKGDISLTVDSLRFFAGAARNLQGLSTGEYVENHTSMVRRDPMGVVGAITPWNYPLLMTAWKIGPALATGNTVVLKPSKLTPLSTLLLAELSTDIFPPGVINVVTGHAKPVGDAISHHPNIKMVSITGSVNAGKAVAQAAVGTLKKVHLELGGKAPVIIFDDADISAAIQQIKIASFHNSGQDCTAATRIYVSDKIYDRFLKELIPVIEGIQVGDPNSKSTEMGPLVSEAHLKGVKGFVDRATQNPGCEVLTGGVALEGSGFYYKPTVIVGAKQSDEIIQEEVFGPVITVNQFTSDEEAIELANDSNYALTASVWTHDLDRAMKVTKRLQYGAVWTNTHLTLTSEMPHGGSKLSGYGNDLSMYSLEEYTEIKHVMIKTQ
ncbi:betaine-aldehyde dehydrogenase/aminobutyraldehyde dehydrogenase [Alteribacillus persepolensis]|uniref:Betaine-aldehyde dehydrogenase/aminobutyraldehyde dehydrogenase n=1 Tax=Alteribacillus persepolensis TaxID=568899 RepID=A0A1G8KFA6_9BACI|nr:gamma-aminobutyraldehyde dehydrogenase [Alteribacillus persepolensis]SDI41560.1 betaine-aldehyde dehydrogenase/aminobutyraldehyde dehydrogenase [Alteribacillus persepolensis]